MAKAEPNPAEVNRLVRGEPGPETETVDVKYALSALRSENARLKEQAESNARTHERNQEMNQKNYEGWRRENLRLQTELLASQERVYELQDKLLAVRKTIDQPWTKE
jgi:predicted RNase H-like nuclease (RuvC/YqgF family)